jgi:hypothetical protein
MILNPTATSAPSAPSTYPSILAALTRDKWQVVNEGSSGAQLKRPRTMMTQTKVVLTLGGVCLLFFWPIALLFIAVATFDYFVNTKERSYFLNRETPEVPPVK